MNTSDPDVLIVGGGIGGLALGLSLHQAGISARVFEAAPEIHPLVAGFVAAENPRGREQGRRPSVRTLLTGL